MYLRDIMEVCRYKDKTGEKYEMFHGKKKV